MRGLKCEMVTTKRFRKTPSPRALSPTKRGGEGVSVANGAKNVSFWELMRLPGNAPTALNTPADLAG